MSVMLDPVLKKLRKKDASSAEFATQAEVNAGVVNNKAVSPLTLNNWTGEAAVQTVCGVSPVNGNVPLNAANVGARSASSGAVAIPLDSGSFTPAHGEIYTKELASGDTFTFGGTRTATDRTTFELHISQGETAVSFSWGSTIWWMDDDGKFAAGIEAPDFSTASTLYALVFRYDGTRWLGNLAYTE